LSEHLKSLGAHNAFDQQKADFTGISNIPSGLYISKVVHQAVVDVNEEGTEAAAATAAIMMTRAAVMEYPPEEFKCDRPFLFVIHEKVHNSILFMGRFVKPQ
jgi:serpin B